MRLDPDGFRLVDRETQEPGPATASVHGPAADLLLLLYGRRSCADPAFEVAGRTAVLDDWFAHTAF
jgi:hypothetical protein